MTDLGDLPGSSNSEAYGINNSGQVVGRSFYDATGGRAFLWEDGIMTDLGHLLGKGVQIDAYSINDSGQVVGGSSSTTGGRAFLWQGGVMTDLGDLPWGLGSVAIAINNRGQVVGYSGYSGYSGLSTVSTHAFLWQDGVMSDLGTLPGAPYSGAFGINDHGQIVGWSGYSQITPAYDQPVLWQNDEIFDLKELLTDSTGWELEAAFAINDSGQIIGSGIHNGLTRGFLLTPVDMGPETAPVPEAENPFRDEIIDRTGRQNGSFSGSAEFATSGQSLWASGDAPLSFDRQYAVGPDVSVNEMVGADSLVSISVDTHFKAQLEAGLTLSSGFLDVNYGYDVGVDYSFDPATGNLYITTLANHPRGNLNTVAPDASFNLAFDINTGADFSATANVAGLSIPLGTVTINALELEKSLGAGALTGEGSLCLIGSGGGCGLQTSFGELSLNQLGARPDIAALANASGIIRGDVATGPIIAGSLDLDAIALSLGGLPPNLLGGEFNSSLSGLGTASLSYDLIDADLNLGAGLSQTVEFMPNLMVEFSINGHTIVVPAGGSFTVNLGPEARNIALNANYILDNDFTNTVSLTGLADMSANLGHISAVADISIPGFPDPHYEYENTLLSYQSPTFERNLFSLFDDTFQVTGFNSFAPNWVIEVNTPSDEAAPVSRFAGAPAATGNLATDDTENWQVDGTASFEGGQIVLQTNSPTLLFTEVTLPGDVMAITFDFMPVTTVNGDILRLFFGDIELFSLTGDMFGTGWMRTDFIDISAYAGLTDLLTIALLSPDGVHSEMRIANIFLYDTMADIVREVPSVPEPVTLSLMGAGLAGMGWMRRRRAA